MKKVLAIGIVCIYNISIQTFTGNEPFEVIEGRPKLPFIIKLDENILAANKYSNIFKRLRKLYPLLKGSKRFLLISIEEP